MTFGPDTLTWATLFVKSSVPSVQLVLVIVPADESIVVVPAALQFHVGDVAKFDDHCVASTLTEGGSAPPPLNSHAFPALPSQSSVPAPQLAQVPPEHVWLVVHAVVVQFVPQLASVAVSFSQPFPIEPSQLSFPAGQLTQAPLVQVWVFAAHDTDEPHEPVDEQVCTALPEHWVVVGTHTPWQAPPTHADETHGVLLPHAPLNEQVSTLFTLHRVAFGAQTPVHTPPTQAWLLQAVPFCQVPLPSQVCGVCPLHCLAPGVHAVHTPALQTSGQAVPLSHWPLESHVCGSRF
jgi:hypothetical protein